MKKVTLIHTVKPLVWSMENQLKEIMPDVEVMNILDEAIVKMINDNGGFDNHIKRRLISLINLAEQSGCDAILITCSTLSNAVDQIKDLYKIPIYKIDEGMVKEATSTYDKITVVATAKSTLVPTKNSLIQSAEMNHKKISVESFLIEGALEALQKGDTQRHDNLILDFVSQLKDKQVVLLAQGSMGHLDQQLNDLCDFKVLSSPQTAAQLLKADLS